MTDLHPEWQVLPALRPIIATALAIILGITSLSRPQKQPRLILLAISIPALTAFYFYNDLSPEDSLNEIFARFLLIWLAHMSFLLCLVPTKELQLDRKRFTIATKHEAKEISEQVATCRKENISYPKSEHKLQNWWYAYKMLFSRKEIGSSWAAAEAHENVSRRKQEIMQNGFQGQNAIKCPTKTTQSRLSFITRQASILLCRYITLCLYFDPSVYRNMMDGQSWNSLDFATERSTFFRRLLCPYTFSFFHPCETPITTRDILIRVWLGLDLLVSDYLALASIHDILAIIAVTLHLDSPEEWRPLFGSITEAYTVRNFWSRFWHRLIYRSFSAHASIVSRKILRIRRGSVLSRYVNNSLVFLLSGLMHTLVELRQPGRGYECGCWGVTVWYCMQLGAILAEESVQSAWAEVEKHMLLGKRQHILLQRVKRTVGYTWVMIWLLWSRSKTYYPKAFCMMGGQ